MTIRPKDFERLQLDTVENRIIKAMMKGYNHIFMNQNLNHIGRCHDEKICEEDIVKELVIKGFQVHKSYANNVHSGYIVQWRD